MNARSCTNEYMFCVSERGGKKAIRLSRWFKSVYASVAFSGVAFISKTDAEKVRTLAGKGSGVMFEIKTIFGR